MQKKYIPRFYYSMTEKLIPHSIGGVIELNDARRLIGGYRFSHELANLMIQDMITFGLLERGKGRNQNLLKINKIKIPKPGLWFT